MNPMIMMAIMGAMQHMQNQGGENDAKMGSTYNPNQLSTIDDIIKSIKGGIGGQNQDITQNQGYGRGQEWLNSLYNDPEFFKNFEAPAQRQFQEQTIPDLANRFASMGSGGSLGSTGFRNQLGREGSNLQTNLAAMRGGMQQQGVNQQLGYAQQPVNNWMQQMQQSLQPTQNQYTPANGGFFGNILAAMSGGASQGYGQEWGKNQAGSPTTAVKSPIPIAPN